MSRQIIISIKLTLMLTQFRDLAAFDLKAFLNIPHTEASGTMMTWRSAHSIQSALP